MDYEVVDDEIGEEIVLEAADGRRGDGRATQGEVARRSRRRRKRRRSEEEIAEEPLTSLMDLDDVSWKPPEKGDLHDLLSGLDHGDESMQPKKRPGPRKRTKAEEPPPDAPAEEGKKDKGSKRRPESEE